MRLPRLVVLSFVGTVAATAFASQPAAVERGLELFTRTWVPHDSRAAEGGDGLGPMYNASSCAACHAQGGLGGAGGKERNVRLSRAGSTDAFLIDHRFSTLSARPVPSTGGSKVERNTPALFGAGLIDNIADEELHAVAATQTGEITGRVAFTTDGKVARFGWKGHSASLADFVANACANELGLAVDGRPQAQPPKGELYDRLSLMQSAVRQTGSKVDLIAGPKRDMTARDVASLTAFVGSLPAPRQVTEQPGHKEGRALFSTAQCEACHVQTIGKVDGLYSDLLLHDVGRSLSDEGSGYMTRGTEKALLAKVDADGMVEETLSDGSVVRVEATAASQLPPAATEWRTPPLWGIRDSAPYLHDGRAVTLDDAIRAHGGEASGAVTAYNNLEIGQQQTLVAFLESMVAPTVAVATLY